MATNTILTPTAVTREALRILHQKANFIGSINRQYDDSFANSGAKIGTSLKIRKPNQYTVRSGAAIDVQNTTEANVTLSVATQKGVDINFTSNELTMSLDDFSQRILEPAMAVLVANIEADAMNMYKDVYNEISDVGATITLADVLAGSRVLTESLAPYGGRTLNLNPTDNASLVAALSGLFNPQGALSQNYREGMVANQFVGYETVYENSLWPSHTTGADDGTGDYKTNGSSQTGATLTIDTGSSGTFLIGDIVTAGKNRAHAESGNSLGSLMRMVVTANSGTSATSLKISPTLVASGAGKNVTAALADEAQIFKRESDASQAIGASADYTISCGYHKDAFCFATADLVMPNGVDFSAREVLDGVSLRIVRQYDINNDSFPCRLDILYGYKTLRPELAVRYGFN